MHGRSKQRVDEAVARIEGVSAGGGGVVGAYVRDFDSLSDVKSLAHDVLNNHPRLDVLDNNAGRALGGAFIVIFNPLVHCTKLYPGGCDHRRAIQV